MLQTVQCTNCGKDFQRPRGRYNEAIKYGWKQFCSLDCQIKSKTTSITSKCGRRGCNNLVTRKLNEHLKFGGAYCSQTCAAIVNNTKFPKKHAVIKVCAYCGRNFKSREKYCSFKCKNLDALVSPEFLFGELNKFVVAEGRIPMKREFSHYHAVRSRFGTWNKFIAKAGYHPNPVLFSEKYVGKDGHVCDSFAEKIIDDWLFRRKIEHKRSVLYPGNYKFTCDFVVDKYWIEFFGLYESHKKYKQRCKQKINLARKYKLELIELYPKDLFPVGHIEDKLKFLL